MLRFLKSFFSKKDTVAEPAPYKVEAPVPVAQPQCGCGRSPSGFCIGLHKLTAEEWAAHPDNPVKPVAVTSPAEAAPVKKVPTKKKPAAMKAPAKPKAPRKPKAK